VAQCFRRASISSSDRILSFMASAFGQQKNGGTRTKPPSCEEAPKWAMASRLSTPFEGRNQKAATPSQDLSEAGSDEAERISNRFPESGLACRSGHVTASVRRSA
jgi:hypothetical protein